MLSYRHGFHAGNWADPHKHAALALLLSHLRAKDKPFCVIDAYAGDGIYDLTGGEALKTGEFRDGIGKIWRRTDAPAGVDWYLDQVRAASPGGMLATYPGSPALIRAALRPDDRLVLGELHPAAHAALRRWAGSDRRIAVHRRDALEMTHALVPPPERRGLVFLDPPYEVKTEYEQVPAAIARALGKWPDGIFAVWYPVLAEGREVALLDGLAALPAKAVLQSELAPTRPPTRMRAAGMVVVNPPWQFETALKTAAEWLADALFGAEGCCHRMKWLRHSGTA